MTPELAATLVFTLVLLIIAALWAVSWWAGRKFGGDEHDTIGPP